MLKVDVLDMKGKKVKDIELNENVFGVDVNDIVVHTALVNYLANQRQGTGSTKTRAEVRGGGSRRKYRIIDFKRNKVDMEATVIGIEYDPNRTANIALIEYEDKERAYIIAPVGLKDGDKVISSEKADIKPGNCMPIRSIPVGTMIYNIELHKGQGAKLVRSAGMSAQLMAKEDKYAHVRMPSGEMRLILVDCRACIGQVGNLEHENVSLGKAGRKRNMGVRPTVRGSVMNPCDHPHGGGEGRAPVGHAGPMTPWGKPALGYKTRKTKNPTDKYIVKRRNRK